VNVCVAMSLRRLVVALAVALLPVVLGDVGDCTYSWGDKSWNFSPLIAANGSYTWTQTLYVPDDTNALDGGPIPTETFTLEAQVCGNVVSQFPSCTHPSPVNIIDSNGNCTYLGDLAVAAFDVNPYSDGAYLTYYHGSYVDHINKFLARIYFVCEPSMFGTPLYLEHMKADIYQYHFKFYTKLAC